MKDKLTHLMYETDSELITVLCFILLKCIKAETSTDEPIPFDGSHYPQDDGGNRYGLQPPF